MFVVFLCFMFANTLLNSISLIRRHVPESLLLTLYLILVHNAQRNIGIKRYNLEIETAPQ
jgi:magnesium-transporting ATPase (P-type)